MREYRDVFKNENIYIHNYYDKVNDVGRYRYDYAYIWRGYTPTGRVSKYWHSLQTNKKDGYKNVNLPKLPKGYIWSEPFIYEIYNT